MITEYIYYTMKCSPGAIRNLYEISQGFPVKTLRDPAAISTEKVLYCRKLIVKVENCCCNYTKIMV